MIITQRVLDTQVQTIGTGFVLLQQIQIQLPWVVRVDVEFFAKQEGGFNAAYWKLAGLIAYNNVGQLIAAGVSNNPVKSSGATAWDVRARIVGTDSIAFEVQGATGMTVNWIMDGHWRAVE